MFAQTHTCLGYILLGRWQSYSFVLSTRYVYWLSPWHYFRFIRSYFIWNKWRCQWLLKSVFFSFGWYHFISLIQVSHYILGLDNNNNHIEIQLCMQSMDKWTKKKINFNCHWTSSKANQKYFLSRRSSAESISAINCWIQKVAEVWSSGQMICFELTGYMR